MPKRFRILKVWQGPHCLKVSVFRDKRDCAYLIGTTRKYTPSPSSIGRIVSLVDGLKPYVDIWTNGALDVRYFVDGF